MRCCSKYQQWDRTVKQSTTGIQYFIGLCLTVLSSTQGKTLDQQKKKRGVTEGSENG